MNWIHDKAKPVSESSRAAASQRQLQLTKPPGSLGRLEELAIQLAGLQGREKPNIERPFIRIYAADHGVVEEGVSAFPQEVTVQMILNFANGGAAISVLANELEADFQVINMGTVNAVPETAHVKECGIASGTKNFCREAAMTEAQLSQALNTGKTIVDDAVARGADIFIAGEMGIGNTTSATALTSALLNQSPEDLVGRGTGVDDAGLQRKVEVVQAALSLHKHSLTSAEACLRCLGGFEIAALAGSFIRCAQTGIPAMVDGFICSAAALVATSINESVSPWLIFSHQSAEQGHKLLLNTMQVKPILSLDMRLGEGSGAAVSLPLLKLACVLHNNMATFDEASVSNKQS
jgi:nicotinate-nucleotide--dimethylbenzimidazole phosphoribosyltransferase